MGHGRFLFEEHDYWSPLLVNLAFRVLEHRVIGGLQAAENLQAPLLRHTTHHLPMIEWSEYLRRLVALLLVLMED